MELRNRWVHFTIADVYVPEPQTLLMQLHGADVLQGQVIDVSASGQHGDDFVVVRVEGLEPLLIVPVSSIKGVV